VKAIETITSKLRALRKRGQPARSTVPESGGGGGPIGSTAPPDEGLSTPFHPGGALEAHPAANMVRGYVAATGGLDPVALRTVAGLDSIHAHQMKRKRSLGAMWECFQAWRLDRQVKAYWRKNPWAHPAFAPYANLMQGENGRPGPELRQMFWALFCETPARQRTRIEAECERWFVPGGPPMTAASTRSNDGSALHFDSRAS
jgi:hypothetical protein